MEKPVERNQRIVWDEMATTVGWSKVSAMEDGEPVGEMKSDKYQFYCSDFGTEQVKDGMVQLLKEYTWWPSSRFYYASLRYL